MKKLLVILGILSLSMVSLFGAAPTFPDGTFTGKYDIFPTSSTNYTIIFKKSCKFNLTVGNFMSGSVLSVKITYICYENENIVFKTITYEKNYSINYQTVNITVDNIFRVDIIYPNSSCESSFTSYVDDTLNITKDTVVVHDTVETCGGTVKTKSLKSASAPTIYIDQNDYVVVESEIEVENIVVYNISGQIATEDENENAVYVGNLVKGVYVANITLKNGEKLTYKFVR